MHLYNLRSNSSTLYIKQQLLQQQLLKFSLFNLLLVAFLGLTLRSYPFLNMPLKYGNFLHAHSHFAFGGWVMPVLVWMIMQYFPDLTAKIQYVHWRNIVFLILFSAYGMLFSFPFQGYGPVSILFSSISIIVGIYLSFVINRISGKEKQSVSLSFLRAGLIYLVLSSLGPLFTGPLIKMGKGGSPIYFDAIYFFLHFQYNGWFAFTILAVLIKIIEGSQEIIHGKLLFNLFNISCIPTYFLSVLWHHPGSIFYFVGGIGAFLQLIAIYILLINFKKLKGSSGLIKTIMNIAFSALVIKIILQLLSAFPRIADLAYSNRNFIIAYLHLVLLGFITTFAFAFILRSDKGFITSLTKFSLVAFFISFTTTEALLVLNNVLIHYNLSIPHFSGLLFYLSLLFPVGALGMYLIIFNYYKSVRALYI